jgi:hypothetical protein
MRMNEWDWLAVLKEVESAGCQSAPSLISYVGATSHLAHQTWWWNCAHQWLASDSLQQCHATSTTIRNWGLMNLIRCVSRAWDSLPWEAKILLEEIKRHSMHRTINRRNSSDGDIWTKQNGTIRNTCLTQRLGRWLTYTSILSANSSHSSHLTQKLL